MVKGEHNRGPILPRLHSVQNVWLSLKQQPVSYSVHYHE